MTTRRTCDRLGNQIIRNLAISLIASKHNLCVGYSNKELTDQLGIELFCGSKVHTVTCDIHECNYVSVYHDDNLQCNLNPNHACFQTKDITGFIYKHLHSFAVKSSIIRHNLHKGRYKSNNDLFVHVKCTDVCNFSQCIRHYQSTIHSIHYDQMYISSDDASHPIVKGLVGAYPNAHWVDHGEVEALQLASTCRSVLLSHGSFSAVIGYLAFFSTVYFQDYGLDKMWHGDMFSIPGWIKVPCPFECDAITHAPE